MKSTAEPLHHQWIKVRGNQLERVEVEIASTSGPLTILPHSHAFWRVKRTEMLGGSLTRYHTPVLTSQEGKGLTEDLIKLAGPLVLQQAQARLQDIQRGMSAADTWANRIAQVNRGLKRKAPAMAWAVGKHKVKNTYKRAAKRARDIFGV